MDDAGPTRPDETAPEGRYELRGKLGSGGTGVVYRAFDCVRGREVALKSLRNTEGRDLFRFKREFRSLADLAHPNLIALYELSTAGSDWMFTMELVDGQPFTSWVRGAGHDPTLDETRPGASAGFAAVDEARLRDGLAQLADGLLALHEAGKLHRDVKPSNVLVDDAGRVVLLDFGLVADVERSDRTHERAAVGTPAFMAPEQAADLPLSAAADWYAVGVILYEALTGRRPFVGSRPEMLRRKRVEDPPAPRALDPAVPDDLDRLCMALLERQPGRRPEGHAVLAALGRAPSAATELIARHANRTPFVGRGDELGALREALAASRRGSVVEVILGASGMGKSSLIRAFLDEVHDDDLVVLEGRCFERETMPYKTLDGVIDELAAHLVTWPRRPAGVGPRDLASVLRLFPVLRRVPWMVVPTLPGSLPADPGELRRRALGALRMILQAMAAESPVVVVIDDLQWGDVDGATALADLLDAPDDAAQPGLLVVVGHRAEDVADGAALAVMRRRLAGRLREVSLSALDERDARALWQHLTGHADDQAVHDAAGSPLLLGEIAQAQVSGAGRVATVEDAVRLRMAALAPDARALLDVVAVAARPLRLAVAPRAAGIADGDAALLALRAERLVRVRGADPVVEARHDRIRSAVVATLSEARRREIHASLAETLSGAGVDEPELIDHWLGAGDGLRAAEIAERAAERAEERLAFHRAADLLGLALLRAELPDDRRCALLARRGEALAAMGRLVEAAVELRGASALAAGRERRRLERLAIENLLRAGQLDRGLGAAASLLRELGESLPTRPVVAFLTERARLRLRGLAFVSRAEGEVDELTLDRLDLLWSLASGLSFADPRLGVAMHSRMLRLALDAGEPRRIALALGMELGYVAIGGAAAGARLEEVRSRAAELARQLGQPDVDGFVALGSGAGAYLAGRFREGVAGLEAGASMMRQLSMSMRWQLDLADTLRVAALWWLGDLRRLAQVHAEGLRTADEGGSVDAQRHLRCWPGSVVPLMRGEPGESRAQIDAARPPRRPDERFHLHHYHALAGRAFVDLYEGQGGEAHRRVEEAWRHVERSGVMRVQIVAIEARYLRGAAAIAARGAAAANLALACAAQIDRFGVTHGRALAELLRGLVLAARDDHAAAAATLRSAVRHAEAADAGLFAAAARRRLGLLLGRDGAHLVTAADDWLRSQAVTDPARLAAMLVPPPAA